MSVIVLNTAKRSPKQILLLADEQVEQMAHVAVIYIPKGKKHPILYCSTMEPVDMCFLGTALQNHSLSFMED